MKIISAILICALLCSCKAVKKDTSETESDNPQAGTQITSEIGSEAETGAGGPEIAEDERNEGMNITDLYSVSNKGLGWGFVKKKGEKPEIPAETTEMMTGYNTFYMDLREERVLYLTFDEGYENGYTADILDTLKKCNVPAAFFITGDYFDREQELVERMFEEGHIIGNHTENHPNLHKLENPEKMLEELKILDDKFFERFGEHMKYMRPPEGEYSPRVLAAAQFAGYKTVLWSFAYKDWQRDVIHGGKYACDAVTPYFHNGAIILLHAVSKDNAEALESIIRCAREEGYEFKVLDYIK